MADDQVPNYNDAERRVLRQARELKDIQHSSGWKVYVEMLDDMIKLREPLVNSPLHDIESLPGETHEGKVCRIENVKGALIGLKLARATLDNTIIAADEIREAHSGEDDEK